MPIEDRKRWVKDIQDSAPRIAQKSHPAFEPSLPPPPIEEPWGHPVPGVGSPSVHAPMQQKLDAHHNALKGVWGIIAILVGAAGGGWAARAFAGDYVTTAQLKAQEEALRDLKASVGAIRETQIGTQKDIEWMKDTLRTSQMPEPLEVKKKR
jgi:hypothetical protein